MPQPRLWQAARVQPVRFVGVMLNLEAVASDGETGKGSACGRKSVWQTMSKAVAKLRAAARARLATGSPVRAREICEPRSQPLGRIRKSIRGGSVSRGAHPLPTRISAPHCSHKSQTSSRERSSLTGGHLHGNSLCTFQPTTTSVALDESRVGERRAQIPDEGVILHLSQLGGRRCIHTISNLSTTTRSRTIAEA